MKFIAEVHIPSAGLEPPEPPLEYPWVMKIFDFIDNAHKDDVVYVDDDPLWVSGNEEAESLVFLGSDSLAVLSGYVRKIAAHPAVPAGAYARLLDADTFFNNPIKSGEADIFVDARTR